MLDPGEPQHLQEVAGTESHKLGRWLAYRENENQGEFEPYRFRQNIFHANLV